MLGKHQNSQQAIVRFQAQYELLITVIDYFCIIKMFFKIKFDNLSIFRFCAKALIIDL